MVYITFSKFYPETSNVFHFTNITFSVQITTVLPLSAFCTITSLFLRKIFNASNSSLGKFFSGVLPVSLNITYTDFTLSFEMLYRDVDSLEVSNLDKAFIKSILRDSAFSSYKDTAKTLENLPNEEFDALKALLKNMDIIVQRAHKGNTVVTLNRKDYFCKMKNIRNDGGKFQDVYRP